MSTHSRLAPSKAEQWTTCTRSISFIAENEHRVIDSTSTYAQEGTEAHEWAAKVLLTPLTVEGIPEEFQQHVRSYVEACQALLTPGALAYVERQVPLFYMPSEVGTVDFMAVSPNGIHVRDLKYGAGVLVDTEFNKQLAIYAYSAICDLLDAGLFDFPLTTPVSIGIIQPRHHEWEDAPWETTLGELREFCEIEIETPAKLILEGGPTVFAPSEKACRWCLAGAFCPERGNLLAPLPFDAFDDWPDPVPTLEELTDEDILAVFTNTAQIKAYLNDVAEYLLTRALNGKALPGTKLVQGRQGNRDWTDEARVNKVLLSLGLKAYEDRYKLELLSPAKIEKNLKSIAVDPAEIARYTTRSEGKPVITLETDKRPAITAGVDLFDDLPSNQNQQTDKTQ